MCVNPRLHPAFSQRQDANNFLLQALLWKLIDDVAGDVWSPTDLFTTSADHGKRNQYAITQLHTSGTVVHKVSRGLSVTHRES